MIKTKINSVYPAHRVVSYQEDLHVVDYTNLTKTEPIKRSVEIHTEKPEDADCFILHNLPSLNVGTVVYDNDSFVDTDGKPQSQCECVIFPYNSDEKSWILLVELKYCLYKNAKKRLYEASKQLFATYEYFKAEGITTDKQTKYLIVSLPQQNNVPFEGFIFTQTKLLYWKKKEGIIFRGVNEAVIQNSSVLNV